ncbi:hypothetical protein SSP24_32590 [Streptomyces spinoverrucosus]|uniref:Uncharacterized protein n=1 Tax=Streptomyces spinoverrucosus TaxID=284043 RepID=A0A4Y3VFD8_9ACTN|nr:hypothetical protein [Streptomyces spinoverrucosus]GEC05604.1 hypothetical protein SSP24_32590 [Streptomyces spinoverrucosus]GHB77505.1 hypothetical protein GCM10010397_55090 [Streptomyces spinoverrucosus]
MHRPPRRDPHPPRSAATLHPAPVRQDHPRLPIPPHLATSLGHDAVGTPVEHGESILNALPRVGCVFGDDRHWWWIVPAGSHIGITWPPSTTYAIGAGMRDPSWTATRPKPGTDHPRLIHSPMDGSPYTPPIPLYFLTCRLTGSNPSWSLGATG